MNILGPSLWIFETLLKKIACDFAASTQCKISNNTRPNDSPDNEMSVDAMGMIKVLHHKRNSGQEPDAEPNQQKLAF